MKPKYYILIIVALLILVLLPELAFAQRVLTGWEALGWMILMIVFIPILIGVICAILIEPFVFWLLANKIFKVHIRFSKILLYTSIANISSFLVWVGLIYLYISSGDFIRTSSSIIPGGPFFLPSVVISFILFAYIEWTIYIKLFRKINIEKFDLLKISFIANFISTVVNMIFLITR